MDGWTEVSQYSRHIFKNAGDHNTCLVHKLMYVYGTLYFQVGWHVLGEVVQLIP